MNYEYIYIIYEYILFIVSMNITSTDMTYKYLYVVVYILFIAKLLFYDPGEYWYDITDNTRQFPSISW